MNMSWITVHKGSLYIVVCKTDWRVYFEIFQMLLKETVLTLGVSRDIIFQLELAWTQMLRNL